MSKIGDDTIAQVKKDEAEHAASIKVERILAANRDKLEEIIHLLELEKLLRNGRRMVYHEVLITPEIMKASQNEENVWVKTNLL